MWSNFVDEIEYLSQQGYDSMDRGNYHSARHFFMNAASKAMNLIEIDSSKKIQNLITSLLDMARNAEQLRKPLTPKPVQTAKIIQTRKKPSNGKIKQSEDHNQLEEVQTKINVPLGKIVDSEKNILWQPETLMNGIVTITGGSGSGKTECLKIFSQTLANLGYPCLILDLHGDIEIPSIRTVSLDYTAKFGINPMELTSKEVADGGPIPHINRLMNQFSKAIQDRFSATQKSWLRTALKFAYIEHGILQENPETWSNKAPNFSFLLRLLQQPELHIINSKQEEFVRKFENTSDMTITAVENRLLPILEHPAFSTKSPVSLLELIKKPTRILLKPLNTVEMQFLAADTIIQQIYGYMKSIGHVKEDQEKFRLFLFIDEVKILSGFRGKINDPYNILNVLATEARKFGIGLILASQILAHFGRDIRSNSSTKLILRTMDSDEAKSSARELKLKVDQLMKIKKPGEGYLVTSRITQAQHIQLIRLEDQQLKAMDI